MPAKKKIKKTPKETKSVSNDSQSINVKVENLEEEAVISSSDKTVKENFNHKVDTKEIKDTSKDFDQDITKDASVENDLRPFGIKEVDTMLGGGLPEKATVLLSGGAGVGKTTLAMEWLFRGYDNYKETGLYITLTEPTTVAIHNLRGKKFFNKDNIASCDTNASQVQSEIASREGVHFVDLRQLLEEMDLFKTEYTYDDIDKIQSVLFDLIMNAGVKRVVIDSITAIAYLLGDKNLIRTFIYKIGKFLALSNSNTLLIGEAKDDNLSEFGVEEFISDGVIRLSYDGNGNFPIRMLQIKKMRGIPFDSSLTPYKITDDGIQLFPRVIKDLSHKSSEKRVPTEIPGFDKLVSGGLISESTILVSGPSGGGKTLFSIQTMLSSLKRGVKCLYFSHEESKGQILRNARSFGWDLESYEKKGLLRIESIHPDEIHLSELIYTVKEIIKEFKPSFIVVDSLTAMSNLYEEEKVHNWASQLISLFKKNNILSMFLSATTNLVGESMASNVGISSLFDQIIMLRFVEIDAEFHHAILIIKMRGSKHDKKMYELVFSNNGLKVARSFSGYEGIFSGTAKKISKSKEDQLRNIFMDILGPMGGELFKEQKEKGLSIDKLNEMVSELSIAMILNSKKEKLFLDSINSVFEGSIDKK